MWNKAILSCLALASAISARAIDARGFWDGPDPFNSPNRPEPVKALYVMSNDAQNSIISMSVAGNGLLSGGRHTSTAGAGGNLINAVTGKPEFPDSLSVQDSVVIAGPFLFNVNAGSGSVSMFQINPSDPSDLTLLGQPMPSNGDFPTSLAVSLELRTVCVANTGAPAGVACASFDFSGLGSFDALRVLDVGETNPPTGPVPGIGDIFFNAESTSLVTMVKGNGVNTTGYVSEFPVANGVVGYTGTEKSPNGTAVLFGSALIPGTSSKVFASDASFGAVVLDLSDLTAPLVKTTVAGQMASCWAQISPFGSGYITDVLVNRLVEVNLDSGAIESEYYAPNKNSGMSDFKIVGSKIWTLSANNGTEPAAVTVFDISGGVGSAQMVQRYSIPGASVNTMGLVVV